MAAILPRLAIGLSHDPDTFDHCRILPLCYADPASLRGPALVSVKCQDHPDPVFTGRSVTTSLAPRGFRRTGYGTRLRWAIELTFETMAGMAGQSWPDIPGGGSMPATIPPNQYATDSSLFVLASAFGRSSARAKQPASTSTSPPHLFLTTTYQLATEQWFPIDVHPDNTSTAEAPYSLKTFLRSMTFEVVSRFTFMDVGVLYQPAAVVHSGTGPVTSLTAPAPGRITATVGLSVPLRADLNPGDVMLIQFQDSGPHVFYRFTIQSISSDRLTIQTSCPDQWPYGSAGHSPNSYWTFSQDPFYKVPFYACYGYDGALYPPPGGGKFTPNQGYTILIG